MSGITILRSVKRAIRYPRTKGHIRYIVLADGSALSVNAAKENWREIVFATLRQNNSGWHVKRVSVCHTLRNSPICSHFGTPIVVKERLAPPPSIFPPFIGYEKGGDRLLRRCG